MKKYRFVSGVNKTSHFVNNMSLYDLLPYSPKQQLVGISNVPYNLVDGASLRDCLIMLAEVIKNQRTRLPRSNGRWEGTPGKWYSDNQNVNTITAENQLNLYLNDFSLIYKN
ncbi:hypothetical protein M3580_03215 [Bacillus safensis]|uniref:hypothetical protein n=1 Tax=Bacillus safensis TaxID=561879 RepID=UPI002041F31A|nr:hypothetical protein [Bacillus safensis]MCM2988252.1 hypothetical protein [Bacillus safensis]